MKNFKEFGTLLTREESKEIKGGYDTMIVVGGKEDDGKLPTSCTSAMCDKQDPCHDGVGRGTCKSHAFGCGCLH